MNMKRKLKKVDISGCVNVRLMDRECWPIAEKQDVDKSIKTMLLDIDATFL